MADGPMDLEISRLLAAPRAKVWRAWEDPVRLAQWWCPKPWTTEVRKFDFRAGGDFYTFMRGPDGGESDNPGCFLEIVPQERITFTSMLTGGYRPNAPWIAITAIFTMADEGQGTRYIVRVLHKDGADAQKHVDMGFYDGFGTCITQLEDVAKAM